MLFAKSFLENGLNDFLKKPKRALQNLNMLKLLALHTTLKHFNFLSKIQTLALKLVAMATSISLATEIIPTTKITMVHTDNEPSIPVEHFSTIKNSKKWV